MQCVSISPSLLTAGLLSSSLSSSHFTLFAVLHIIKLALDLCQLLPVYMLHLTDTELQQFSRHVGSPVQWKVRRKSSTSGAGYRSGTGNAKFDQNESNSSRVVIARNKHKLVAVNLQRIQIDTSGAHRGEGWGGCSPAHPTPPHPTEYIFKKYSFCWRDDVKRLTCFTLRQK